MLLFRAIIAITAILKHLAISINSMLLLIHAIVAITAILKHLAISINSMLFKYVKIACYSF